MKILLTDKEELELNAKMDMFINLDLPDSCPECKCPKGWHKVTCRQGRSEHAR